MNGAFNLFWGKGGINPKDKDYSIELDAEEMLLNIILNTISVRAAVRLIETEVKFTSASSIQFSSAFELFHVASISIWFHEYNAR